MSNIQKLVADLKQMQAQSNQIKAAGEQAMKQAAPGGKGFTVGLRLHRTPSPRRSPQTVAKIGKNAMVNEFNKVAGK
jgi:hypothetical protein